MTAMSAEDVKVLVQTPTAEAVKEAKKGMFEMMQNVKEEEKKEKKQEEIEKKAAAAVNRYVWGCCNYNKNRGMRYSETRTYFPGVDGYIWENRSAFQLKIPKNTFCDVLICVPWARVG